MAFPRKESPVPLDSLLVIEVEFKSYRRLEDSLPHLLSE